jgi:PAS domain S-box-containing protein
MMVRSLGLIKRYAPGVLLVAFALYLTVEIKLFSEQLKFFLLFGSVFFTAWYSGTGPAIVATCLATSGAMYFLFPPLSSFEAGHAISLASFFGMSSILVTLIGRHKGDNEKLVQLNADLRREIVERKRTEAAPARLAAIVESSEDAIIGKTLEGTVTNWNAGAEHLFGYTAGEVIGKSILAIIPPDRAEEESKIIERMRQGNRIEHFETVRVGKDGRQIDVSLSISPIKDNAGNIIGVSKIARDISERKQAEEALRQSEALKAAMLESSLEAIITIDHEGKVIDTNQTVEGVFGYTREQMLGKEMASLIIPPSLREQHRRGLAHYLTTGEGPVLGKRIELVAMHADGREFPVELAISPIRSPGKTMFTGYVRDITERKRAEEALYQLNAELETRVAERTAELETVNETLESTVKELTRSNADLEQFAYVSSHDLQEPLRMVTSYVQLLDRRYKHTFDETARQYMNFALDGATRMKALITDLLTYARVGGENKGFERVDSAAIVAEAFKNLKALVKESGASITVDPLPQIYGSRTELQQLFQNLINNAIKYRSDLPPAIHVAVSEEPGWHVFSVTDNGIGIDPKYFDRIFLIFHRLHDRETYPGTGIGLALCKKIVEHHGGKLWVTSQAGRGSTFYFSIPVREAVHDDARAR